MIGNMVTLDIRKTLYSLCGNSTSDHLDINGKDTLNQNKEKVNFLDIMLNFATHIKTISKKMSKAVGYLFLELLSPKTHPTNIILLCYLPLPFLPGVLRLNIT